MRHCTITTYLDKDWNDDNISLAIRTSLPDSNSALPSIRYDFVDLRLLQLCLAFHNLLLIELF